MADDYYGTLDAEVARGAPNYRPGHAFIPELRLGANLALTRHWLLLGSLNYAQLPEKLADSPLLDGDEILTVRAGIAYRF